MASQIPLPAPPEGLGERGARFWRAASDSFELNLDERELLLEVARELDLVETLNGQIQLDGVMTRGSAGQPVAHPALAALHTARTTLGRMLAQLGLPTEDDEAAVVSPTSARARKAAQVRWALQRQRESRPLDGGRRGA